MSLEDKDDDEVLAYYLEIGVVNLEGMDENGEVIYSINQEMAKEYAPELWQSHIDYVDQSLINLYEAGLAEIEYDEDPGNNTFKSRRSKASQRNGLSRNGYYRF